jgi:hypothetical protein
MRRNKLDIFGKIDAIVEKHDATVLTDKPVSTDDFPKLTDVINKDAPVSFNLLASTTPFDGVSHSAHDIPEEHHIVFQIEKKMSKLFDQQQINLEKTIRQIIREELGKD